MVALLVLLLFVHGSLHLLGFFKAWGLAALPQFSGRAIVPLSETVVRALGVLWLAACLLFVGAAALRLARHESWWIAALAGVLLSQALVVLQWHDAKAGAIANAIVALAVVVSVAKIGFRHHVDDEVHALFARAADSPESIVASAEIESLPVPVRRWLTRSGVIGKPRASVIRLRQRGEMRTSPSQGWMPAAAEQYFSVEKPGFVWRVDVTMLHALPIGGRDKYEDGHGNMLIKAGYLANVIDASGPAIDQGTMLRFLGEIVWFPSAALEPYIEWEELDPGRAQATMRYGSVTASAIFAIDERGRVTGITAQRYMGNGPSATLEHWSVPSAEWRVVRGIEIPVKGDVVWRLKSGDFDYYRWEIVDVEYGVARLYSEDPPADAPRREIPGIAAIDRP